MGGIVGGPRTYEGPGLPGGDWAPWKCPACAVENTGSIDDGCVHCGSGSAKPQHIGQPPAADLHLEPPPQRVEGWMAQSEDAAKLEPGLALLAADMEHAQTIYEIARQWVAAHAEADPFAAFIAGYQLASQEAKAHTMQAPPVTADVAALAPEGKARRTIIAALEIFKDQILRGATDEIASGEWCSIEETDALIRQLKEEEEP